MAVCKIPECYNDVQCPTMGLCKACYSSMLMMGKKPSQAQLQRLRNLEKYRARTALMAGNVSNIPKRQPVTLTILPGHFRPKLKIVKKKSKNKLHTA